MAVSLWLRPRREGECSGAARKGGRLLGILRVTLVKETRRDMMAMKKVMRPKKLKLKTPRLLKSSSLIPLQRLHLSGIRPRASPAQWTVR